MKQKLFSYNYLDTPVHRLSGLTKFICFLLLTFAIMFSFDIRAISVIFVIALLVLRLSRIAFSQIRVMVIYVVIFVLTNAALTFLFAPEQGVEIYGTRHVLFSIAGPYIMTAEQLFYQLTKLMKYASSVPLGIVFLLTTNPSEFASALCGAGVNYKAAYAVALTLRYFPDVQRDYGDISLAQQARGLDLSHKAGLVRRFKGAAMVLFPLIFSTLDRIESISNAMDLRGFGKLKHRTWYAREPLTKADFLALSLSAAIFTATVLISVFINKSRFYNPFL